MSKKTSDEKIKVKVLRRDGQMSLLQYARSDGELVRCVLKRSIPTAFAEVDLSEIEASPPFGIPFADFKNIVLDAAEIEQILHRYGIWESGDFDNPEALNHALLNLGRLVIGKLQSLIEEA